MKSDMKYTLVQHSGFGYAGDRQFMKAVELRPVEGRQIEAVKKAGGLLFDTYEQADKAEQSENYPPDVNGLIPCCLGTFHRSTVDKLKVYVPKSKPKARKS